MTGPAPARHAPKRTLDALRAAKLDVINEHEAPERWFGLPVQPFRRSMEIMS